MILTTSKPGRIACCPCYEATYFTVMRAVYLPSSVFAIGTFCFVAVVLTNL